MTQCFVPGGRLTNSISASNFDWDYSFNTINAADNTARIDSGHAGARSCIGPKLEPLLLIEQLLRRTKYLITPDNFQLTLPGNPSAGGDHGSGAKGRRLRWPLAEITVLNRIDTR